MTPRALFHPARLARRPVLSTQSDERLIDLVRAGSDPAFETIVERYRRPLMRYAARLLPPERAEDVVQQSFVNAYEAIRRDEAEIHLRPWLYRIAHNNALNALRDRGLRHAELDERIDGVERPDQALERVQGLRALVVAVQALPARQRDAILLRELEGRSYEEIAAALGVTDGAVRQLLHRARRSLRSAAAALLPGPLLTRVADAGSAEPMAARVADLVGVSTAGAVAAKVCATALVTGAVVGGVAVAPRSGGGEPPAAAVAAEEERAAEARTETGAPGDGAGAATRDEAGERSGGQGSGPGGDDRSEGEGEGEGERSGPGGGAGRRDGGDDGGGGGDRSGSGDGDDRGGFGGGGDAPDDDEDDRSGSNSGPEPDEPELEEASEDRSGSGDGTPDYSTETDEPDSSGPG